nr:Dyp-type peroxidase domain-containing protein [Amycolatopsis sp. FDAARGOS 1241]
MELPDEDKPGDSHIVLTVITDEDGTELEILRDNMPFGRRGRRSATRYTKTCSHTRMTRSATRSPSPTNRRHSTPVRS